MRLVCAVTWAAVLGAAACSGADPARCRLRSGLYEQRLALAAAPPPAANGGASTDGPAAALAGVVREYGDFFQALSEALGSNDPKDVPGCCAEAASDRVGALSCQLAVYLAGGRVDRPTFLASFPTARKDALTLADLDSIASAAGGSLPKAFQPKGPSYRFVDELFLLVLEGNEDAIVKYFALAGNASPDTARYMDEKLVTLLKEAPATVVGSWFQLRKHKAKFKSAAQAFTAAAPPAEVQLVVRAVHALCREDDPDCQEILKLFPKK